MRRLSLLWPVLGVLLGLVSPAPVPVLLLLDSFSQTLSGYAKAYCSERGVLVVEAITPYSQAMLARRGAEVPASLRTPPPGMEAEWAESQLPEDARLLGCLSESDAGVPTAERISLALDLPCNGQAEHLRDKFLTNQVLTQAGLKTAAQLLSSDWESLKKELLETSMLSPEGLFKCVVKPYRGVASDGVHLCHSLDEVETAFKKLLHSSKYGGGRQDQVLVQEYLDGEEFAIDTVSCNGIIKITAVWKYRKLSKNNAPFVYQCTVTVIFSPSSNLITIGADRCD